MLIGSIDHSLRIKSLVVLLLYFGASIYVIIFMTRSRKGIIIVLLATTMLFLYWIWQQPRQRRLLYSVFVVVFFALLGYGLYTSPQFSRIADLSQFLGGSTADRDLVFRGSQLKSAILIFGYSILLPVWDLTNSGRFLEGTISPIRSTTMLSCSQITG